MSSKARALAEQIISLIAVNPLGHYERDETDWDTHALSTEDFIAKMTPLTAAALAAERATVWEEAAQEADHIVKVADSTIEGRDGYEWIRLNAIIAEFTCYRNWCRARGKGET